MHLIPSLIALASATTVFGTAISRPHLKRACDRKGSSGNGTFHIHQHEGSSGAALPSMSGYSSAMASVVPSSVADTSAASTTGVTSAVPAAASGLSSADTGDVIGTTSTLATASAVAALVTAATVPSTSSLVDQVARPSSTSSAAAVMTSAATTGTGTGTKKAGLGINSNSGNGLQEFVDIAGSQISWEYNWYSLPDTNDPTGVEYVPMFHDGGSLEGFATNSPKWPGLGVKNLLSLNEPDLNQISAAQGATWHQQAFNDALAGAYKIGSPAVARGGKQWMSDWVTACAGKCAYDFVAVHFYGTNADDLITYVKDFITTFVKPVWVTEYGCQDYSGKGQICSAEEATAFQKTVIDYFTGDDNVIRYAAFGAFPDMASSQNGNALVDASGQLNALGKMYATAI